MKIESTPQPPPSKGRLFLGGFIFVAGQLVPLTVPIVARSALPTVWKTIVSAVLLISPELFILIAVAFLGKTGFDHLVGLFKRAFGRFFEKHGPPETVSRTRYRIGLVLFALPIVFAWATPYAIHHLPGFEARPYIYGIPGDILFVVSLFVLGGEFWDKLRSLFVHGATARFPKG